MRGSMGTEKFFTLGAGGTRGYMKRRTGHRNSKTKFLLAAVKHTFSCFMLEKKPHQTQKLFAYNMLK